MCPRQDASDLLSPCARLTGGTISWCAYVDVLIIMQNIPSREGYQYVFFIVDHATKICWVYPLKTRESKFILSHLTTFVNEVLPSLNIRLRHFHSDGGAELVAADVLTFLHKSGVTTSHSPRDTPQMNSITERWVRSLKEKVLCMLLRSLLPVAFWWLAVECTVYLLNRLPTKTVLGYMSPYECVYGAAPDLKWILEELSDPHDILDGKEACEVLSLHGRHCVGGMKTKNIS